MPPPQTTPDPEFDFDSCPDRRASDSAKWHRYGDRDVLPMWIADMDFVSCPAIVRALRERAEHGVYGYATPPPGLVPAFLAHCQRLYGWQPAPEWVMLVPGLVPALHLVCLGLTEPGDQIMVFTPVYPPFLSAPATTGRQVLPVPLGRNGGSYCLDWAAMEAAVTARTRMVLFCSPHNPVGRAFTQSELTRLVGFCRRHRLTLCSDEIHCDLVLDGSRHLPVLDAPGADPTRTVVLMSPTKTYNIAGTNLGVVVAPDPQVRHRLLAAQQGLMPHVNTFGYAAALAALREGEPWRRQLIEVLRRNAARVSQFVTTAMPGFRVAPVQATYLAWIDCRGARLPQPPAAFFEAAGIGLSDGLPYGERGFVRLNFGCPAAQLELALARMRAALPD